MAEIIGRNESVYVHCRSGVGRSAALVAAYLINMGSTVEQAWAHIGKTRPFIRPTKMQMDSIDTYADKLKAGLC